MPCAYVVAGPAASSAPCRSGPRRRRGELAREGLDGAEPRAAWRQEREHRGEAPARARRSPKAARSLDSVMGSVLRILAAVAETRRVPVTHFLTLGASTTSSLAHTSGVPPDALPMT